MLTKGHIRNAYVYIHTKHKYEYKMEEWTIFNIILIKSIDDPQSPTCCIMAYTLKDNEPQVFLNINKLSKLSCFAHGQIYGKRYKMDYVRCMIISARREASRNRSLSSKQQTGRGKTRHHCKVKMTIRFSSED